MVSSFHEQSFLDWLTILQERGWRGMVHVAGSQAFCLDMTTNLREGGCFRAVVQLPDEQYKGSVAQHIQSLLGSETDALVINAFRGFNPNALGAAAGCIRAGGVLVLMTPPEVQWPSYPDPDYRRMLSAEEDLPNVPGRFIRHVLGCLQSAVAVMKLEEGQPVRWPVMPAGVPAFCVDYSAQQAAIAAICRVATGHARRPLVLQADRGRGKSAALGMGAASLLLEKPRRIIVTAPHSQCVQTLFAHAAAIGGVCHDGGDSLVIGQGELCFMPVDVLLEALPSADLMLVDEAAAIPSAMLEQLAGHYKRLVFSTTVQGYEGNGRGFAIRFLPHLQKIMPQLRHLTLENPLRYAADDPLEQFCHAALLLKVPPAVPVLPGPVSWCCLPRDGLLSNQCLLQQVFGLLVNAHYQTSPDDLRLMLDHPDVRLFVLQQGEAVLAVALLMEEGGLDAGKISEWTASHRRFRGHLLPQALALGGRSSLLQMRMQRVVRIAVLPECQRQGYGRQLLHALEQYLIEEDMADFIGASFSAEVPVLGFWQAARLHVVRLGVHRESSTGQFAAMVLKPLNPHALVAYHAIRKQFSASIAYQLLVQHAGIEAGLALALLRDVHLVHDDNDLAMVCDYCRQACSFETAQPALYRFFLSQAGHIVVPQPGHLLLVRRLLQNRPWAVVSVEFGLAGRAQAESLVRETLQILSGQLN